MDQVAARSLDSSSVSECDASPQLPTAASEIYRISLDQLLSRTPSCTSFIRSAKLTISWGKLAVTSGKDTCCWRQLKAEAASFSGTPVSSSVYVCSSSSTDWLLVWSRLSSRVPADKQKQHLWNLFQSRICWRVGTCLFWSACCVRSVLFQRLQISSPFFPCARRGFDSHMNRVSHSTRQLASLGVSLVRGGVLRQRGVTRKATRLHLGDLPPTQLHNLETHAR